MSSSKIKSFTGDIVKYDQERKQLIVKNFKKSMSTIIRISDIQKISLVPHTIRIAQQKHRKLQAWEACGVFTF